MAHPEKIEKVNQLSKKIKDKSLIYVDYKGIKVHECDVIRGLLREEGSRLLVCKNTLLKKAFEKNKVTFDKDVFTSMTAITIMDPENFGSSGKILYEAEKKEQLIIKGGHDQGAVVAAEYVQKLASIPSREVLYGMFVGSLEGILFNLVSVLEALKNQKQEKEPAATQESSQNK